MDGRARRRSRKQYFCVCFGSPRPRRSWLWFSDFESKRSTFSRMSAFRVGVVTTFWTKPVRRRQGPLLVKLAGQAVSSYRRATNSGISFETHFEEFREAQPFSLLGHRYIGVTVLAIKSSNCRKIHGFCIAPRHDTAMPSNASFPPSLQFRILAT
jgi:hypothetical protein